MKKLIFLVLVASVLIGCSGNEKVVLPAALFTDMSDEEIKALKDEQGYEEVTVNDDDTVTLIMSKEKHEEIVDGIHKDLDNSFDEVINADSSFITKVEKNDQLDHFIFVGKESAYEESYAVYAELSVLMNAYYYHFFQGKSEDEIEITFEYIDPNGNTYKTETYPKVE